VMRWWSGYTETTARSLVLIRDWSSSVLPVSCRLRHLLCCIMLRHWR